MPKGKYDRRSLASIVPPRELGGRIRALREARKIQQQDLADAIGIGPPHLNRFEMGTHSLGNIVTVVRLAQALDVTVDFLLFGREERVANPQIARRLWKLDALSDAQAAALAVVVDAMHASAGGPKRGRGGRSSDDAGGVTAEMLLREIAREPDRRMELLARSLGAPSQALAPLVKQLVAQGRVKARGKARGTTYRPG
jgi:transcriptional regulator with XRE-family HTH domain